MKINNSTLSSYLKNVIFITGSACSGKTTIAKSISDKFGLRCYQEGFFRQKHFESLSSENRMLSLTNEERKEILTNSHAGIICDYFEKSAEEETELILMDLVYLSFNDVVVTDVIIPPQILNKIAKPEQVLMLTSTEERIRRDFFEREDKASLREKIYHHSGSAGIKNYLDGVILAHVPYDTQNFNVLNIDDSETLLQHLNKAEDILLPYITERVSVDKFLNKYGDQFQKNAISYGDRCITYAELIGLSNSFSNVFMKRGVGKSSNCAVFSDLSPRAVVNILGLIKAGANVLFLDRQKYEKSTANEIMDEHGYSIFDDECLLNFDDITSSRLNYMQSDNEGGQICVSTYRLGQIFKYTHSEIIQKFFEEEFDSDSEILWIMHCLINGLKMDLKIF